MIRLSHGPLPLPLSHRSRWMFDVLIIPLFFLVVLGTSRFVVGQDARFQDQVQLQLQLQEQQQKQHEQQKQQLQQQQQQQQQQQPRPPTVQQQSQNGFLKKRHKGGRDLPDPKTVEAKHYSRRRFVSYRSSEWERFWLKNIDRWQNDRSICTILLEDQAEIVRDYLSILCTSYMPVPFDSWCVIDDEFHPLWYNTERRFGRDDFQLTFARPSLIPDHIPIPAPEPVNPGPQHDHIFSRFVFYDEILQEHFVEYIEPLVSHLRFPLAKCLEPHPHTAEYQHNYLTFRGWILPPPPITASKLERAIYFDAGSATNWKYGRGSPSLQYLTSMWDRHGISIDQIYAYETTTPRDDGHRGGRGKTEFIDSVPPEFRSRIHYQQVVVSSEPDRDSTGSPFLPLRINRMSGFDDYVIFTLDVDSPPIEDGNVRFVIEDTESKIDEFIWEHHVTGNYLLSNEWGDNVADMSLKESYMYFLKLRQKGIRAHSWI